jgi:lysophospholipase L1-like esterase
MRFLAMLAIFCGFAYGVAVGHYQLFPFDQVQDGISWIRYGTSSPRSAARQVISDSSRVAPPDVVLLGDSITAAGDWTHLLPGVKLASHGIGGDVVSDVRDRLDLTINVKPKLVLLMIGINDLSRGSHLQSMLQSYHGILVRLNDANIKIIAQSVLITARADLNVAIIATNKAIADICDQVPRCHYVDLNGVIAPNGMLKLTDDGVHLTAPAYELWARAIEPLVRQYR